MMKQDKNNDGIDIKNQKELILKIEQANIK